MADPLFQPEFIEGELSLSEEIDELGVLSSTRPVLEQGEHAWINQEGVTRLGALWEAQWTHSGISTIPEWYERSHFFDGTERTANWFLLLDALNFCFWAERGVPRWSIVYKGEKLNGYMAEAVALKRAVEENIPLWDAEYLSSISSEQLAQIFRSEPAGLTLPLFEQRLEIVREVGRILLERFEGQFVRAIEQAEGSAVRLVLLLTQHFPSFADLAIYRQHTVRFYKRAQICVADLHTAFSAEGWGAFRDIEQLTAFADYKVPQVLRHAGVLEYAPSLAKRIDNQEIVAQGSEAEIEIRAATIWACELLRREMLVHGFSVTPVQIDQHLWLLGQHSTEMRPYHRTRTIYY